MNVRISRHVFGCVQGYRTLGASPDVDRSDIFELETFSFGQTNATEYLDSLGHNPAYWCRWLRSGRWALTRVLKGKPDDKGRSTLLFVTALLDPSEWVGALGADATPLLCCDQLWVWSGESVLSSVKLNVGEPDKPVPGDTQRARVLSMLALVESRHGKPNETIVTSEHQFSPEDVRLLAMLLPHTSKESFSYAVRSLSEGLPVTINCLAGNASHGASARRIIRWSRGASYDPPVYTSAVAFFWKPGSPPPWKFVANCRAFGEAARQIRKAETPLGHSIGDAVSAGKEAPSSKPKRSWVNRYVVLAAALLILVGATACLVVWVRHKKQEDETRVQHAQKAFEDARAFIKGNSSSGFLPRDPKERKKLINRSKSIREQLRTTIDVPLESVDQQVRRDDLDNLNDWLFFANERDQTQSSIEKVLNEFDAFKNQTDLESPNPDGEQVRNDILSWKVKIQEQQRIASPLGPLYNDELRQASDEVDEWEQYLDELPIKRLLVEFDTFANEARLSELSERDRYPTDDIRRDVEEWTKQLLRQRETDTRIGDTLDTRLQDALARLDEWEQTCQRIILSCDEELQHLRAYYEQDLPTVLRNDFVNEFDSMGKRLDALPTRMAYVPKGLGTDRTPSLCKELQTVETLAEARKDAINKLRDRFTADYEQVEWLFDQYALHLSPPDARELRLPWKGAEEARRRCDSALRDWSDHKECKDRCDRIEEWRERASLSAYEYFRKVVDEADEAFRKWQQPPNRKAGEPAFAETRIEEAMEYYGQMRGAIEQHDKNNEYIEKATELESQIIAAQQKEPPENEGNPP